MVKGISRQVIVVHPPEQKLFEQAIFILRDDVVQRGGITEDRLLREATYLLHGEVSRDRFWWRYGLVWACGGALLTVLVWLMTALL